MIKVEGEPKFDAITLGDLTVNRVDQPGDKVTAKFAFVHSGSRQTLGWTVLEGMVLLSERSRELLSKLAESLERDAARVLYNTDSQPKEEDHGNEPQGLADAVEEADQI